jgi:hypothetical protein
MNKSCYKITLFALMLLRASDLLADEVASTIESIHLGFMYPNGVDIAGYTVEKKFSNELYSFYTFGVPSFAAVGVTYNKNYKGNGVTGSFGVGIGSIMYGSFAYQWQIGKSDYLKLGAGLTTGVAYSGGFPALSYEHRFTVKPY